MLDGPRSQVILQAANRLHFQMSLLVWLLGGRTRIETRDRADREDRDHDTIRRTVQRQLRPVTIERGFVRNSAGSVLYRAGGTVVVVTAQLSETVPPFLEGKSLGWLTAEYAMMPGSTPTRVRRGPDGRATEIQRLIGRSLRAIVDRQALGACTIHVDADVLNADGGTRTAAITAAFVAVADALEDTVRRPGPRHSPRQRRGRQRRDRSRRAGARPRLQRGFGRRSRYQRGSPRTRGAGRSPGDRRRGDVLARQLDALLDLSERGIDQLTRLQREALGPDWPLAE